MDSEEDSELSEGDSESEPESVAQPEQVTMKNQLQQYTVVEFARIAWSPENGYRKYFDSIYTLCRVYIWRKQPN